MAKKIDKTYSIGLDVGGTNIKAVLFDGEKVVAADQLGTPKDSFDHFLVMAKALVEPILERARELKAKPAGIGLGAAGVIDYNEGRMLDSPNLPILNNKKIAEELATVLDLPVVIDNDANTFIRAEAALGAAKKFKSAYGLIVGTGIGGGWWVNNGIYRAQHGGSGEPGEMIIDFGERLKLEPAYHQLTQGSPAQLAEKAYRGDVLAEKMFQELGGFLGLALANIVNLLAPDAVVIGGGVAESSELFLSRARKVMRENIASSEVRKHVKLVKGKLGENAGAIGASLLVDRES